MRVCRARQLAVLAYPVYGTRESQVMGLYGSRDHLGFQQMSMVINFAPDLVMALLSNIDRE